MRHRCSGLHSNPTDIEALPGRLRAVILVVGLLVKFFGMIPGGNQLRLGFLVYL